MGHCLKGLAMRKIKLEALIEAQRKYLEYLEAQLALEQSEPRRRETRRSITITYADLVYLNWQNDKLPDYQ
jgi:hypothetical protein